MPKKMPKDKPKDVPKKYVLFPGSLSELNGMGGDHPYYEVAGHMVRAYACATSASPFNIQANTDNQMIRELVKSGFDGVVRYSMVPDPHNSGHYFAQGVPIRKQTPESGE